MLAFSHLFHITFQLFSLLFRFSLLSLALFRPLFRCCCHWQGKQVGHQLVNPLPSPALLLHTCRCRTCYHFESRARPPTAANWPSGPCNKFIFKLLIEYYLLNLQALNVNVGLAGQMWRGRGRYTLRLPFSSFIFFPTFLVFTFGVF